MPKVQTDYTNTIIYKLCCKDTSIKDIYIGHTTNIIQRKNNHRICCNNEDRNGYDRYVYQFIRNHGGWDNWELIPIEELNCKNKTEAVIKERQWIETLSSKLNCNNPITTKEEKDKQKQDWYEENKDHILQKAKENYEENKEEKNEKAKQYAIKNKEKISEYQKEYSEQNKEKLSEQKKIYRETHKEEAAKAQKEWREENKEKLKEQKSQIINCECGHQTTVANKIRHLQTKVHIDYQNQLCGIIVPQLSEEEKCIKLKEQQKMYRETRSEQIKLCKKINYEKNKEAILEQQRKYKEDHKAELIEQNKKYVEENKEKIQANKNKWYEDNKEKILQKQKEMITCDCGAQIRKSGRAEHLRSKKHKDFLEIVNVAVCA